MKNWKNVGKWRRTASIILAASMFFGAALGLSGCNAGRQNGAFMNGLQTQPLKSMPKLENAHTLHGFLLGVFLGHVKMCIRDRGITLLLSEVDMPRTPVSANRKNTVPDLPNGLAGDFFRIDHRFGRQLSGNVFP